MKSIENTKLKGSFTFILTKANGEVETLLKDNIIVDDGFDFIANSLGAGARPGVISHIALGTGVVAANATDTALGAELVRESAVYSHTTGTKVLSFSNTFSAGVGTGAITEAGMFNAAAAGIMFDRVVFPVINKGADDTLTATFTLTMS